jgi:O-antigen/teichoic acid export membrane protein
VLLGLQRAILVEGRRTRHVTVASTIEVGMVALTFVILGWGLGLIGATAAFASFLIGRAASNGYLFFSCLGVLGASDLNPRRV